MSLLTNAQALKRNVQRSEPYDLARAVVSKVAAHDITGLAAELAYRGLLAIFPFFIFVGALSAYVAAAFHVRDPAARIIERLGDTLPPDAASVLQKQLSGILEARQPGLLFFGLIGAVIAASAAMNTMVKALNRVYDVEETRPFWRKTAVSLGLTVLAGTTLVASFVLLVTGQVFGQAIADAVGLGGVYGPLVNLARWPIVLALVLAGATIIYRYAPARRPKVPWAPVGALFFTVSWVTATFLFGLYIQHSNGYHVSYGALAGVVILMIWFYLTALLFLVGAEINRLVMNEGPAQQLEGRLKPQASARATR